MISIVFVRIPFRFRPCPLKSRSSSLSFAAITSRLASDGGAVPFDENTQYDVIAEVITSSAAYTVEVRRIGTTIFFGYGGGTGQLGFNTRGIRHARQRDKGTFASINRIRIIIYTRSHI